MRAAILGVLALLPALPPADPVAVFRERLRDLDGKEEAAWAGFQNRFAEGLAKFVRPWERAHSEPDFPQDSTWDYAPFHALYGEFVALRAARAEAAEALAGSRDPGGAAAIFREVLDLATAADGAEAAMEQRMAPVGQMMSDQRPGVLRHALAREEARLLPALAKCPDAEGFLLGEGWKRAEAGDGKASVLRRVAVIDALGSIRSPGAMAFLEKRLRDRGSTFRIAALEGLLPRGKEATLALLPLLRDPSPVVRFALLQGLRAAEGPDPRWIRALVEEWPKEPGRLRADHLAAVRALSGRGIGDDPAAWKAWLEANAAAVDGGTLPPPAPRPPGGADTDPGPAAISFYGARAVTRRPVFLVDGSFVLHYPADTSIQATRNSSRWEHRPKPRWMDPPPVQFGILLREWRAASAAFPEGTAFGLFATLGRNEVRPFEDGRMVRACPKAAADAAGFLEGLGAAGSAGPYEGLREVFRAVGLDPSPAAADFPRPLADTAFLVHSGVPSGGRYVGAEPVVEAVARLQRFRRLAVHAVRIGNGKDEAERTLRGIALGSGGGYAWRAKPPAE
jgi:hypothetical protein